MKLSEDRYTETRAELVRDFWFLKSKRCKLAAKARIRKIADLDFEQNGTPREKTLEKFNYEKL